MHDSLITNENIQSRAENGSAVSQNAEYNMGDLGCDLLDQVAVENGICVERDGAEISCAVIEVDPASI